MSESAPTPRRERVIVGMSGGVDSFVSALLLLQQGYQVEGLFMKNWDEDDGTEYCTAREDLADAQAVCDRIGIKLHTANFAAEYWDNVFEHFLAEYKAGRTPNPDILCNREIKFKAFLDYALMLGADLIATGHYVRRRDRDGRTELLKGLDPNKDQSYFLHAVGGEQIARSLFPVGELEKPEVRAIAEKHGLATAKKKDSTGICFIGERRFTDFLKQYLPAQPGDIETIEGKVIGRHSGLMYHTIGQRQGLGIGGLKEAGDDPWYVLGKDLQRNVLLVGQGNDHPLLFSRALLASRIYWVNPVELERPRRLRAKVRYRQSDQDCVLEKTAEGYRAVFDEPQRSDPGAIGGVLRRRRLPRRRRDRNGGSLGFRRTPVSDPRQQLIALGAVFESAALVDKLARTGQISEAPLGCMLGSLLARNPASTLDVYGGDSLNLRDGFKALASALERKPGSLQREPLRYALAMLTLERQLDKRGDMLDLIGQRLDQVEQQVQHFGLVHENVIASFASIYQDTLSTFRQRIQVHGDMRHLQVSSNAARIRALLLAGIRSARLWRQLGGSRWQMVFSRRRLLNELYPLLRG